MFLKRTANIRTFFDSANFSALFSQKIYIFSGNGIFLRENEAAYVHSDGLEPSVIKALGVDGSVFCDGTFHDFGVQRGRFRSGD